MKRISFALLFSLLSLQTQASVCSGFLPENDLSIPVAETLANETTEEQFNDVIDRIAAMYKDDIEARGFNLVVEKKWTSGSVNAQAREKLKDKFVTINGGIARHPLMNSDGLAIVVCHEFGHHLGGAEKYERPMTWATVEGQSDYFASTKCLRELWRGDKNEDIVATYGEIPEIVTDACAKSFSSRNEKALCTRTQMASYKVSQMVYLLSRHPKRPKPDGPPPSFSTPDPSVVDITEGNHPKAQCRLDTWTSGSVCEVSYQTLPDDRDVTKGACNEGTHKAGLRPRCWFAPPKAE